MTGNYKLRMLYFLITILLTATVVAPEHLGQQGTEDIDWNSLEDVNAVDDTAFFSALQSDPLLLSNPEVLASLDIRVSTGNVGLVNQNLAVLRAWGSYLGIEFSTGSAIQKYDGASITTQGNNAVTFNPDHVPGATVQQDGSLKLPNQYLLSGQVEKTDEGLTIIGLIRDENGNHITNEASHMILSDDGFISTYGTTKVKTKSGDYKTISGERSEYTIHFNDQNQLVVTAFTLTDIRNPVKIISKKPENTIVLLSGRATIINVDTIRLDEIRIAGNVLPAMVEVVGESLEQASALSVIKPTLLCFGECGNLNQIDPQDYTMSSIEILRPLTYNGKRYNRNLLKITAKDNNQIEAHLTNPDYTSIFVDARGENRVHITQEGTVLAGLRVKPYYLEIDATAGGYIYRGKQDKSIAGSPLFILNEDAVFNDEHHLTAGGIRVFDPNIVGGMGYLKAESDFDLQAYHLGDPVPYTSVGSFKGVPSLFPVLPSGDIVGLDLEDIKQMSRDDLIAHLQENLLVANDADDFFRLSQFINRFEILNGEWAAEDSKAWNRILFEKLKALHANQFEKMDESNWDMLDVLAQRGGITQEEDPVFYDEAFQRAQQRFESDDDASLLISLYQQLGNNKEAERTIFEETERLLAREETYNPGTYLHMLPEGQRKQERLKVFHRMIEQGKFFDAFNSLGVDLHGTEEFNAYLAGGGKDTAFQTAQQIYNQNIEDPGEKRRSVNKAIHLLINYVNDPDKTREFCLQAVQDGRMSTDSFEYRNLCHIQ